METVTQFSNYVTGTEDRAKTDAERRNMPPAAVVIIDRLWQDYVDMTPKRDDQTLLDYAYSTLRLKPDDMLNTIQARYAGLMGQLLNFKKALRSPSVDLLPPLVGGKGYDGTRQRTNFQFRSVEDRMNRIVANLHSMYMNVYHTHRMGKMCTEHVAPPPSEMLTNFPELPTTEKEEQQPQHKLILFALTKLASMNARRLDGEWVMCPTITSTGYYSTAFHRFCKIDEFLQRTIDKEADPDMWHIYTQAERLGNYATRVLREHHNREFPDLQRCRTKFAWNNGIYFAHESEFLPFGEFQRRNRFAVSDYLNDPDLRHREQQMASTREQTWAMQLSQWNFEPEDTSPAGVGRGEMQRKRREALEAQLKHISQGDEHVLDTAACVYFDMDFPQPELRIPDPLDIATPYFDMIWEAQDLGVGEDGPSILEWICTLIGRMLYDVGTLEDWQISPFFKGVAGTGKSTILRLIRMFYEGDDVGVMSNNIEGKFGLAALYEKLIVICFEMRSNFGLDQADLQTLMSGEPMSIPIKHQTALPNIQWTAPFAAAGNMTGGWPDTQGSMSRRGVIVEFSKPVKNGNPNLMRHLKEEMPYVLLKCNRCYLDKVRRFGKKSPWDRDPVTRRPVCLPEYFHQQADRLRTALNTLQSFIIDSGEVRLLSETVEFKEAAKRGETVDAESNDINYYTRWETFVRAYKDYCKNASSRAANMTSEDEYLGTLTAHSLRREKSKTLMDIGKTNNLVLGSWLIGCRLVSTLEIEDGDEEDGG